MCWVFYCLCQRFFSRALAEPPRVSDRYQPLITLRLESRFRIPTPYKYFSGPLQLYLLFHVINEILFKRNSNNLLIRIKIMKTHCRNIPKVELRFKTHKTVRVKYCWKYYACSNLYRLNAKRWTRIIYFIFD